MRFLTTSASSSISSQTVFTVKRPANSYVIFKTEKLKTVPAMSLTDSNRELGKQWRQLTEEEKRLYQDRYLASMAQYKKQLRELNPIKFTSARCLFVTDRLINLKDAKPNERLKVAAEEWERLTENEKTEYEQRFRESVRAFNAWEQRLCPTERIRKDDLMYLKQNKVRKYTNVYMFFLVHYLSSLKDVKTTDRMKVAREEWDRLSDDQKAEYEQKFRDHLVEFKAREEELLAARRLEQATKESMEDMKNKPRQLRSVYQLFLTERLANLKDLNGKDRMRVAAADWRNMSAESRAEWEQRFEQHNLDLKAQ